MLIWITKLKLNRIMFKALLWFMLILHVILIVVELYLYHSTKSKGKMVMRRFVLLQFVPILGPLLTIFVILFVYYESKEFSEKQNQK